MPHPAITHTLLDYTASAEGTPRRRQQTLPKTGAWHNAMLGSASFWGMTTKEKNLIPTRNAGAKRMPGHFAADGLKNITPADVSDAKDAMTCAKAPCVKLDTADTTGLQIEEKRKTNRPDAASQQHQGGASRQAPRAADLAP